MSRNGLSMLIGIIGNIRSGKSTVARILEQRYGFAHVSTNLELSKHLESLGTSNLNRTERFEEAQKLRQSQGSGILVHRALEDPKARSAEHVVLTGIYVKGEADTLLGRPDHGETHLVVVETLDDDVRWFRLMSSVRGPRDYFTREEFDSFGHNNQVGPNFSEMIQELPKRPYRLQNNDAIAHLIVNVDTMLNVFSENLRVKSGVKELDLTEKYDAPLDDYSHVMELERRYQIGEHLKTYFRSATESAEGISWDHFPKHQVRELGNQFLRRMVECFMWSDCEEAFRRYKCLDVYTVNEELASLLNQEEFRYCHARIHEEIENAKIEIHETVINNLRSSFIEHDATQRSSLVKRPLQNLLRNGINCDVAPLSESSNSWDLLERARERSADGDLPILEYVKRDRILKIQGLKQPSKVSLAIHDAVDHVWFTNLLDSESGDTSVLKRHTELLRSVGNPVHFDLFRRESEMIASIAFGVRYWASQQIGFVPRVSFGEIRAVFEAAITSGKFIEERHLHAYRNVLNLAERPRQREVQSLEFCFSNYITELDEQRRKHGEIKLYGSPITTPTGKLDPWGIDYLSFFVDAHHMITRSKSFHRDTLLKVHVMLEEWLATVERSDPRSLLLKNSAIQEFDVSKSSVSLEKKNWMEVNFGFTAYKEPLH